jgi:Pericentrin-AKAP-450 domain of centrosomal targeting protein
MQIEWMRARCHREENFRAAAAYAKKYMALQIALFEAWYVSFLIIFPTVTPSIQKSQCWHFARSNKADIKLLEKAVGQRVPPRPKKKRTFRQVAQMVRATVRMKKNAELWGENRKLNEKIKAKVEQQRRMARKSLTTGGWWR